ncbi:GNAT family N-acetyltransferase [Cohnella endophytica]|uniref:GNAT family N-acetyltransferase n=1 Tax=Cohnella endophytica TaxID=2419778 RepID=UPI003898F9E3
MTVLHATIQQLDEIASLFNAYRVFYGQPSDIEGARQFLFDRFAHRESVILVARHQDDGKLVGFTQLYPTFSSISMRRAWVLNDLYVLEDYRGLGISHRLLEAAKEYAQATDAKGLSLETAVDNIVARGLYEKHGYTCDDHYVHYELTIKKS